MKLRFFRRVALMGYFWGMACSFAAMIKFGDANPWTLWSCLILNTLGFSYMWACLSVEDVKPEFKEARKVLNG